MSLVRVPSLAKFCSTIARVVENPQNAGVLPQHIARRHFASEIAIISIVVLALKSLLAQGSSALWRAFPEHFDRWQPAGLPYYAIWGGFLLLWSATRAETQIYWKVPKELWTRTNTLILVGVILATEALYSFKMGRLITGYSPPFELVSSLGYALSAAVAAPVVEEILFRGYLWREITQRSPSARAGIVTGILVTSTLFAVWHLALIFGPYPTSLTEWPPLHAHFLFGVIMAILRWRLGSISLCVVIHGLWNLL